MWRSSSARLAASWTDQPLRGGKYADGEAVFFDGLTVGESDYIKVGAMEFHYPSQQGVYLAVPVSLIAHVVADLMQLLHHTAFSGVPTDGCQITLLPLFCKKK